MQTEELEQFCSRCHEQADYPMICKHCREVLCCPDEAEQKHECCRHCFPAEIDQVQAQADHFAMRAQAWFQKYAALEGALGDAIQRRRNQRQRSEAE